MPIAHARARRRARRRARGSSRHSAYAASRSLGVHPPGPPGGGVEGPAHAGRADRGGEVDAGAQVVLGRRDGRRVGGDQVAAGRHRARRRTASGRSSRTSAARSLGVEVAGASRAAARPRRSRGGDVAQQAGQVRVGERRGPDPGVDADGSHGGCLPGRRWTGGGPAGLTVSRHPAGHGVGSGDLTLLPDLRVAGQVLATELGVVAVGHAVVGLEVVGALVLGDRDLREHPLVRAPPRPSKIFSTASSGVRHWKFE